METFLVFAHVLAAILFIGPMTVATSLFPSHLGGDGQAAALWHRISRVYGILALAVPLLGFGLAAEDDVFSEPWISASIGLTAVGGVLLGALILPDQRRALAAMREGRQVPPSLVTRLRIVSGLLALSWVAVLWLMFDRPW